MTNPYVIDRDEPDNYSIWHLGECHITCVPRSILISIVDNENQNSELREAIREQLETEYKTLTQENVNGPEVCA